MHFMIVLWLFEHSRGKNLQKDFSELGPDINKWTFASCFWLYLVSREKNPEVVDYVISISGSCKSRRTVRMI